MNRGNVGKNKLPRRRDIRLASAAHQTQGPPLHLRGSVFETTEEAVKITSANQQPLRALRSRNVFSRAEENPLDENAEAKKLHQSSRRLQPRKKIVGTLALLCVSGLFAAMIAPPINVPEAHDSFASVQPQQYAAGGDDPVTGVHIPLSVSPAEEMAPVLGSDGKVIELSSLPNSKTRYPFDNEVPLTSGFGYRSKPVAGFHDAQDMAPADGTTIRIVASGVVTEAGFATDGWCGYALTVQHRINDQSVTSRYCHMQTDSHSYQVGDPVSIGDPAGRVGNTGLSFGSHLHLIISPDDVPTDPLPFLLKYA